MIDKKQVSYKTGPIWEEFDAWAKIVTNNITNSRLDYRGFQCGIHLINTNNDDNKKSQNNNMSEDNKYEHRIAKRIEA